MKGAARRDRRSRVARREALRRDLPEDEDEKRHHARGETHPGGAEQLGRGVGGDRGGADVGDVVPDQDRDEEPLGVLFQLL